MPLSGIRVSGIRVLTPAFYIFVSAGQATGALTNPVRRDGCLYPISAQY
jgi:hypothetical protein